jgi:hypothetical protein
MTTKRILVLANSTKHHPMRCVAGREVLHCISLTPAFNDLHYKVIATVLELPS